MELSTLVLNQLAHKGPMPGKESRRIRVMAFNNNFYRLDMWFSEPYNEFRGGLKPVESIRTPRIIVYSLR